MPNHCENDLSFSGPADQIEALRQHIGAVGDEPQFDFNSLIPYPDEFEARDTLCRRITNREATEEDRTAAKAEYALRYGTPDRGHYVDGFNAGGYEWCCATWGTKWGAYNVEYIDDGITFQTAWTPPAEGLFLKLSALFPEVELEHAYYERGAAYQGRATYKGGLLHAAWEGEYDGERGG